MADLRKEPDELLWEDLRALVEDRELVNSDANPVLAANMDEMILGIRLEILARATGVPAWANRLIDVGDARLGIAHPNLSAPRGQEGEKTRRGRGLLERLAVKIGGRHAI